MNDEKFELAMLGLDDIGLSDGAAQLRARDTAQREALARVEEIALEAASLAQRRLEERDAAQAQLAPLQAEMPDLRVNMIKALDLLEVLTSTKYTDRAFAEAVDEADEMLEQLRGKVVLKGLADQQEARGVAHGDDSAPSLVPGLQWAVDYCSAMLRQGNDRMLVEVIRTRLENVLSNQPAAMRAQGNGGADHA